MSGGHASKTYKVRVIDIVYSKPVVIMSSVDAEAMGLKPGIIVTVLNGDKVGVGHLMITSTIVSTGEVALTRDLVNKIKVKDGDVVHIRSVSLPPSFDVLKKRIGGRRISESEFMALIKDFVDGVYDEPEIAAFLVSQLYYPLTDEELTYLTRAMVETGTRAVFDEPVHDVHSIGGVPGNSKVALLTVPIIASAGILIPKTSSRAITSPAGTADTMEVLARVDLELSEIIEIARKTKGLLVWGGKLNLAPADDIFVNVERKLHIDPDQQMIASILSKKLAMSVERLIIDIPTGKGSKVEDMSRAEMLASHFIRQAGLLGIQIKVAITYGGQPIGTTAGPALEAMEALKALIERKGSRSLIDKAILLAGQMFELVGKAPKGGGEEVARDIFITGKAYEKFKEIIEAQGGNPNIKPEDIPVGKYSHTINSPLEGAVTHLDNTAINLVARALGAPFDKGAGIKFHAKVGYRVEKGSPLLTLYSNSQARLETALRLVEELKPIGVEGMLLKTLP